MTRRPFRQKPSGCSKSWQWNRVNTEKWLVVSARISRGKSLKPQMENIVEKAIEHQLNDLGTFDNAKLELTSIWISSMCLGMVCHWKFRSMKCHQSHCKTPALSFFQWRPPLQKVRHPGINGIFNQRLSFKEFVPIGTSHCHLSQSRCTSSLDPSTAASDECLNDEDRDSLVLDLPLKPLHVLPFTVLNFLFWLGERRLSRSTQQWDIKRRLLTTEEWRNIPFFFAWVACMIMYAHTATGNDALWHFHPRCVKMELLEHFWKFLQWKNAGEFGSQFHAHHANAHHARCVINFLFDFLITLHNVGPFHCVEFFWGWNAAWEQWSGPR